MIDQCFVCKNINGRFAFVNSENMRSSLLSLFFISLSLCCFSQSKFSNLFQFSYIASSGGGDGSIVGLKYIGSMAAGEHITAGAGIAHDIWFDNRIRTFNFSSVLADLRYYFKGSDAGSNFFFTPGYAVKVSDRSSTGFNLNTGLGSKIELNSQQKLMVGLGFDFHNVQDEGFKRTFRGVTFNLGLLF